MSIEELLADAARACDADLRALEHVDGDEFKTLLEAHDDPTTDGIECDHHEERL